SDLLRVTEALLPLLLALIAAAVVGNLLQVGFFFRPKLDFEAINIGKGMERLFSRKSLAALAMNVVKLALVTWLAYSLIRNSAARIVELEQMLPAVAWSLGAALLIGVLWRIALLLLALGVVDYFYQRRQHERDLRMTRREVRDELRQATSARRVMRKGAA